VKIVLIGSGHVATVLGRKLAAAGHEILQVFSPNPSHALVLARELGCPYASNWPAVTRKGELYLVAISDRGLRELGQHIDLGDRLTLHTAGAVPKEVLRKVTSHYGVFYPLQSLRKEIREPFEIPVLVDAHSSEDLKRIYALATTISTQVLEADDLTRLKLHVASVFVNNFSNHLYALAESYCLAEKINFSLLLPLIDETARRLHDSSPSELQTGPAIRGDLDTLLHHEGLLKGYPILLDLYQALTKSIQHFGAPAPGD
jgi:predicted dinucleotide-binding enzyme